MKTSLNSLGHTGPLVERIYHYLYLLTAWSRVLLEKLTGSAASQEIPRIFGTRRFLTLLTSARHLSLSWANSIQSPQSPPTSWISILILFFHLRLDLPSGRPRRRWKDNIITTLQHYYKGKIKEYEKVAICGRRGWTHEFVHSLVENPEGKRPLGKVGVNLVMILLCFQKSLMRVYLVNSPGLTHGQVEGPWANGSKFSAP